ncbi:saccharopine dehydrogenase [Streptomyces sp. NPDC058953]|uniref:saccharopine dehydrogenase n=1 Tax=unclassified Streptomyces TaxID=2593676 RepID=UPI00368543E8
MPGLPRLWLRHETRATECRTPLVPADAARLVGRGVRITVEDSAQRVVPLGEYVRAGCDTAPAGSWPQAPDDAYVLGLKELPDEPSALRHRHIYFGHAYKGQPGARALLGRFTAGGGTLLDLEYLTHDDGRRVAAFGYWAGYVGAALAVLHRRGTLKAPLPTMDLVELDGLLRGGGAPDAGEAAGDPGAGDPKVGEATGEASAGLGAGALVIGALGRSGRGACDALETAGIAPVRWDVAETRNLDRAALLSHGLVVNTVLVNRPVPPFLTPEALRSPDRRISVLSDVTCDVGSACNVLPVYDEVTSWERPVRRLVDGDRPVDLIAIDNLPSLLPAEASRAFSAELWPQLLNLPGPGGGEGGGPDCPAWSRAKGRFTEAVHAARLEENPREP